MTEITLIYLQSVTMGNAPFHSFEVHDLFVITFELYYICVINTVKIFV